MSNFAIITDSSADMPDQLIEKYGIEVLQLCFSLNGAAPCANNEITPKELYDVLRNKGTAKTSAANLSVCEELFEKHLAAGEDVLYLCFSSSLSSTYQAALNASKVLREKYPDRKLIVVDTLCASVGQGMLVSLVADRVAAGATIEEAVAYAEELKPHLNHWFTVNDLFFLKRGGRVSAVTAVAGSLLQIKPVMHMDNEGHLTKVSTARGRRASIDALCARMKENMLDRPDQRIFIGHGDCREDAEYLAAKVKAEIGVEVDMINYIGPVIGAHAGPDVLAIFFLGKER